MFNGGGDGKALSKGENCIRVCHLLSPLPMYHDDIFIFLVLLDRL